MRKRPPTLWRALPDVLYPVFREKSSYLDCAAVGLYSPTFSRLVPITSASVQLTYLMALRVTAAWVR